MKKNKFDKCEYLNLNGGIVAYIVLGKYNDKKIITLFAIGRKLALSDALDIVSKVYESSNFN